MIYISTLIRQLDEYRQTLNPDSEVGVMMINHVNLALTELEEVACLDSSRNNII